MSKELTISNPTNFIPALILEVSIENRCGRYLPDRNDIALIMEVSPADAEAKAHYGESFEVVVPVWMYLSLERCQRTAMIFVDQEEIDVKLPLKNQTSLQVFDYKNWLVIE